MKKIFIGLAVVAGTVATIVCNEKFNWGLGKKVTNGYDRAKDGIAKAFSKAATETTAEPKEFISGSSSASLGDLFKGLKLDLEAEEAAAEEAPKKKTTRKKKTEDAE